MSNKIPYARGPIRPPSESESLLVRVTENCWWNKCLNCPVYNREEAGIRLLQNVLKDIDNAQDYHGDIFSSAFLQDSDSLSTDTKDLLTILERISKKFPSIKRITTYATTYSIIRKTDQEMIDLNQAGLNRIHRGLETGYKPLLKWMMQGTTPKLQIQAGKRVKQAGMELSDYVMPGLGGDLQLEGMPAWKRHAEETAYVLKEFNPDFIRLRTLFIAKESPLYNLVQEGKYGRLSDKEVVEETRYFLEKLTEEDKITSKIESDHFINPLMALKGKLPKQKEFLFKIIDDYLALSNEKQGLFRIGSFISSISGLAEHMNYPSNMKFVKPNQLTKRKEYFVRNFLEQIVKENEGQVKCDLENPNAFLGWLVDGRL